MDESLTMECTHSTSSQQVQATIPLGSINELFQDLFQSITNFLIVNLRFNHVLSC